MVGFRHALIALILLAAGCSGTAKIPEMPPVPAWETQAELVGARCADGTQPCKCRQLDGSDDVETAPPAAGMKRFEIRVATGPGKAWLTVNGNRLYKSSERAEECFYLDLPKGKHQVNVRTHSTEPQGGFGVHVKIAEHNPAGNWWYDTFQFECGEPGACDLDTLAAWKREADAYEKNLRDPCGSTKLKGIGWITGRVPDALHPEEISLNVVLDVYDFTPKKEPCRE